MGSERSDEVPAFNLSPLTFRLNSGSAAKAFFDVLTYLDFIHWLGVIFRQTR